MWTAGILSARFRNRFQQPIDRPPDLFLAAPDQRDATFASALAVVEAASERSTTCGDDVGVV